MEFGERLRDLRIRRGISQTELAIKAEVANTYISSVELNRKGIPTGEVVARMAAALKTTSDYLLGLTCNPEIPDTTLNPNPGPLTPAEREAWTARMRAAHYSERDISIVLDLLDRLQPQNTDVIPK